MSAEIESVSSLPGAGSAPRAPLANPRSTGFADASGTARPRWEVCGLIILTATLAMAVDLPLSRAMVEGRKLSFLHRFLESIEPFGQPAAVLTLSLAVLLCGGARRGAGFRIAAGALLPGLAVDVLKLCLVRVRPRNFDFQGTVLNTFRGPFPGARSASDLQSWPSGHTAVAVGFCLALSSLFPRGRWLFRILAALVALQRIETGAHYLSDTLFAAGVAYAVTRIVFGEGPVAAWFDRVEVTWRESGDSTVHGRTAPADFGRSASMPRPVGD